MMRDPDVDKLTQALVLADRRIRRRRRWVQELLDRLRAGENPVVVRIEGPRFDSTQALAWQADLRFDLEDVGASAEELSRLDLGGAKK